MLAVIGIPVYKERLTHFENISLNQVHNVMSSWEKVFIAPESLHIEYGEKFRNYEIMRFDDKYFQSTKTYGELLMKEEFYEKFTEYKFLLIYQLDAFVFSDKLFSFCALNMDFIGAPLKGKTNNWKKYHVGNGGFSLRNIHSCLRVIKEKEAIVNQLVNQCDPIDWSEDDFFAFCGMSSDIDFRVPSPRIAATFSAQTDYAHGLRDISKRGLPFGCHYWTKLNYSFWKPYIEAYGYKLPDSLDVLPTDSLKNDYVSRLLYLTCRCIRKSNTAVISGIISPSIHYAIWGAGIFGTKCVEFFKGLPIQCDITRIYAMDAKKSKINGIEVETPNLDVVKERKELIIIATPKYEDEIRKKLIDAGLRDGVEFITFTQMCERIIQLCTSATAKFSS